MLSVRSAFLRAPARLGQTHGGKKAQFALKSDHRKKSGLCIVLPFFLSLSLALFYPREPLSAAYSNKAEIPKDNMFWMKHQIDTPAGYHKTVNMVSINKIC